MTRQGQHTCVARAPRTSVRAALVLGAFLAVGALATPARAMDTPATPPVMTTEGPDGFLDALRGSTSEQVLRKARCPIVNLPVGSMLGQMNGAP